MASKIVVNLDTSKDTFLNSKCKQNDDLILEANIFENGAAKDLSNCSIVVQAKKADNTYIIQNTDITKDKNKFIANLVRDFTRVPGETLIEVLLKESGKQNTTFSFCFEVVESVIKGAEKSKDLITSLEKMQDAVVEMGKISEETKELIQNSGAASKEDFNKVNTQLEQKAQQIETENLQQQINSIVVNGDGTQNLEVVQARTDYYGSTFNTLKESFDNTINIIKNNKTKINYVDWEQGSYAGDGTLVYSTTRIRTKNLHYLEGGKYLTLKPLEGYRISFSKFNSNKTFVSNYNGWITSETTILIDQPYFRFLISKVGDSTILASDNIYVELFLNLKESERIELGSVSGVDGINVPSATRARTINFIQPITNVVLRVKNNINFAVAKYKVDGTFISSSPSWLQKEAKISYDGSLKYKFIFANSDNTNVDLWTIYNSFEVIEYYNNDIEIVSSNEYINKDDDKVKAYLHRGYNTLAPENTIPAFKLGYEKGFRFFETDLCHTLDDELVLLHDTTINRTSNGTGNIFDLTLEQLLTYDFGSWKSSEYIGTKIPKLSDLLIFAKRMGDVSINLEINRNITWNQQQVEKIVDEVIKYNMLDKVLFVSVDINILNYIANYNENASICVGFTTENALDSSHALQYLTPYINNERKVEASCHYLSITQQLLFDLHNKNICVGAYVVNDKLIANNLLDLGVDCVYTDLLNIKQISNESY